MKDISLRNRYNIRRIVCNNSKVEELCKKCSDYYLLHDGILPTKEEIDEIFTILPPNKNIEDKFILGIYKEDIMVGIIDIIKDFPEVGEWMLGLILIDPLYRGIGLGRDVHKALCEWGVKLGATSFRIGVIEKNYNGNKFWSSLGYKKIKDVEMEFKQNNHTVNVMRLTLV